MNFCIKNVLKANIINILMLMAIVVNPGNYRNDPLLLAIICVRPSMQF